MGDVREIRSAASQRRSDRCQPCGQIFLSAEPTAPRVARHWVMKAVAEAGVHGVSNQVIELLTGELVANAVVHGPSDGQIQVHLDVADDAVRVSVSDECTDRPRPRQPELTDGDGRGMVLVGALADAWGVDRRGKGGKTVWFTVGADGL